ncbi:glycosyltransferase [Alicyclobacillus mengziensis]|uniref:Glycosyltransferase n=1 Tax=Alicyclobacillus mengziensis TaxID=2931921 RepID=A0A9X7Z5U5_9BACL|nr:glycosyltransferase [Alicyclobacillus mengziensis]QSO45528.1 glycosyltransferase [Alicyclobacillus mengziensis]
MRIVLVHDYLNQRGGAERVVGEMHRMYPNAEIYTLFVDRAKLWDSLNDAKIVPSLLQQVPFVRNHFKLFFWLYPFVVRTLKIPDCDVVVTSSSAYAKGIHIETRHGRRPVHVCYCHNPMRFAWDFDAYMKNETGNKLLARLARTLVPFLQRWDMQTVRDVDVFIANSTVVQQRIARIYQRYAEVIFPPVEVPQALSMAKRHQDYYLVVSRLVSYKRIDLAVRACSRLQKRLVVIGTGPDKARLEAMAGPTVEFLGWQSDDVVKRYMWECMALIFPGEEDFGITPVEVNGHGRPVVAYRGGGALDTVVDGINGVFFDRPTVQSLKEALLRVERLEWDGWEIRNIALRFDQTRFQEDFAKVINSVAGKSQVTSAVIEQKEVLGGF